ncbi:FMN-dependent NADH-azoreductase 2 [Brevibacillus laterosporus LMG 15441]|uniref:FMN dependent NADH:quinone oxidoreductase n=2 Tax=Brevibacillus laterosporus TaxID=1465 RepID=A0A075R7V9_BRELA|nr:FMN-dependent NADH-azoreductase 2 [Brevibacillus laterosporus LMG 15441]
MQQAYQAHNKVHTSEGMITKMAKVLYITANPNSVEDSFGLSVGQTFVDAYRQANPQDEVVRVDLFKEDIPMIDGTVLDAWNKLRQGTAFGDLSPEAQAKVGRMGEVLDQFLEADRYVFVTPMWNLSFPPVVKAYIDNVLIAGKTFKYTEAGPAGLLNGKKVLHIQARGGMYSEGPAVDFEFGDKYLKAVMNFIGITDYETLAVEGMNALPAEAENIKAKAKERAVEIAKTFGK